MNDQEKAQDQSKSHSNSVLKVIKLSAFRWPIAALYFWCVLINGVPYEICVPITSQLAEMYETSTSVVTTASTVFLAMHPILSLFAAQLIADRGWASATNLGVVLTVIGCGVKVFINDAGFSVVIIGQVLCGMGRPFILNSQASMAMSWFHPSTRIMIITLLNVVNTFSFVVSAQLPGILFKGYKIHEDLDYHDGKNRMENLCWLEFYISLTIIPCLFLLRSRPKDLQLKIHKIEKKRGMLKVMLRLFKNKNFLLIFLPFSLYFGIMKSYLVIMAVLTAPYTYDVSDVAGVVSYPLFGGLVAQGALPYFVSKYKVLSLFIRSFLFLAAIALFGLYFALRSNAVWSVYLDITLLSILIMPTLPVLMDLSCDMVAPIEPSFAVGALYMGSMAFFVVFTYALNFVAGEEKQDGRVFLTIVSSVVALGLGFLCTLFVKMDGYEPVTTESERHSLVVPVKGNSSVMRGTLSKMSIQYRKSSLFNVMYYVISVPQTTQPLLVMLRLYQVRKSKKQKKQKKINSDYNMQQNITENLIQHYCLVGLDNEYIPMMPSQNRFLTSIQLHEQKIEDIELDDSVQWLDILGNKKIYLFCKYNEKGKTPITNIKFVDANVQENIIQFNYKYSLCPIMKQRNVMQSFSVQDFDHDKHRDHFDLSPYLNTLLPNTSFVLCYTRKTEYRPIINLRLDKYYEDDNHPDIVQFYDFSTKQLVMTKQKPPIEQQYTPTMLDLYPFCYKDSKKVKHSNMFNNNQLLCKLCFPQGVALSDYQEPIPYYQLMKTPSAKFIYLYCLRFYEPVNEKQKLFFGVQKYLPKAIVFISFHSFTHQFSQLMEFIYKSWKEINIEMFIQQLMSSLTFSTNLTLSPLKLILPQQQLIFYETPNYPQCSLQSLNYLFKNIKLDNILMLYSAMLTARRIRLCSSNIQYPGYVIEAMQAFLYPMPYLKIAICYLNIDDMTILQHPDVYIIGIQENIDQPSCEYDGLKFILERNVAYYVIPPPEFPFVKELRKALEPYVDKQITDDEATKIRDSFFKCNLKMLKNYDKIDLKKKEWMAEFQEMKQKKYPAKEFWEIFSKTQLLRYFIDEIRSDVQAYLNTCFQKKDRNRVFIDLKTPDKITTIDIKVMIKKTTQNYFPMLTPYSLITSKKNSIQHQIYRIWFKMINMTLLNTVFYQFAELLRKNDPLIEQFVQEIKSIELPNLDGLNEKVYHLSNECPNCKRIINLEEILHKMPPSYVHRTVRCSKKNGCGQYFIPKMTITEIGQIEIINPFQIKIDQFIFEEQFKSTREFWNIVMYFRLYSLPLPFVNENEEFIFCTQEFERRKKGILLTMNDAIRKLEEEKKVKTNQVLVNQYKQ